MRRLTGKAAQRLWTLLCVLAATAALWSICVTGTYWDDLWFTSGFYQSSAFDRAAEDYVEQAAELGQLAAKQEYEGELAYVERERMARLESLLDPEGTNFRFQIHTQAGVLLADNLKGDTLDRVAEGIDTMTREVIHLTTVDDDGTYSVISTELVIEYGALDPLVHQDAFSNALDTFNVLHHTRLPLIAALAVIFSLGTLAMLPSLWTASRRRAGEGAPRWVDQVPFDLYAGVTAVAFVALLAPGSDILRLFFQDPFYPLAVVGLGCLFALYAFLTLELLASVAARWGHIWQGTVLRRLGRAFLDGLKNTKLLVVSFCLYLLGNGALGFFFWRAMLQSSAWLPFLLLLLFYNLVVLTLLCRWVKRLRAVQEAALKAAVDRETRSQRFQTELITNVSHDLKSPLTSIVSYVDLLQKAPAGDPAIPSYLEVLERKSQQLKRLTEDLIEASKASSGVLPVELAPIGLSELLEQTLGEYREKLDASRLEPVAVKPAEEVMVLADGRHLWRVLDNLLGNCVKHSMPGTRVYMEVLRAGDRGVVTLKNVSAQPLNVPPQELLLRFVRGDAARSGEGSGLGLSIAQSLTELQGGTLELDIDGDLFKVSVKLPLAPRTSPEGTL